MTNTAKGTFFCVIINKSTCLSLFFVTFLVGRMINVKLAKNKLHCRCAATSVCCCTANMQHHASRLAWNQACNGDYSLPRIFRQSAQYPDTQRGMNRQRKTPTFFIRTQSQQQVQTKTLKKRCEHKSFCQKTQWIWELQGYNLVMMSTLTSAKQRQTSVTPKIL